MAERAADPVKQIEAIKKLPGDLHKVHKDDVPPTAFPTHSRIECLPDDTKL